MAISFFLALLHCQPVCYLKLFCLMVLKKGSARFVRSMINSKHSQNKKTELKHLGKMQINCLLIVDLTKKTLLYKYIFINKQKSPSQIKQPLIIKNQKPLQEEI